MQPNNNVLFCHDKYVPMDSMERVGGGTPNYLGASHRSGAP